MCHKVAKVNFVFLSLSSGFFQMKAKIRRMKPVAETIETSDSETDEERFREEIEKRSEKIRARVTKKKKLVVARRRALDKLTKEYLRSNNDSRRKKDGDVELVTESKRKDHVGSVAKVGARLNIKHFPENLTPQQARAEWSRWKRVFEGMMEIEGVSSQKAKYIYLLAYGGKLVQTVDLDRPPLASETQSVESTDEVPKYDNLIKRLDHHFDSSTNIVLEIQIFRSMKQETKESFSDFSLRLRNQARACHFGTAEEDMIKLQIMAGAVCASRLRNEGNIYNKSLSELEDIASRTEISYKIEQNMKASTSSISNFNADEEVSAMQPFRSNQQEYRGNQNQFRGTIHRQRFGSGNRQAFRGDRRQPMYRQQFGRYDESCRACGKPHQPDSRCPAKGRECRNCGRPGHFAAVCSQRRMHVNNIEQELKPNADSKVNGKENDWNC